MFGFRALYARWNIDGQAASVTGADEQYGWYVKPSIKLNEYIGLFTRYSVWDTTAGKNIVGTGAGKFGVYVWDAAGIIILVLAISGIILFYFPAGFREYKKKSISSGSSSK